MGSPPSFQGFITEKELRIKLYQRLTGRKFEDQVSSLGWRCASGEREQDVVRFRTFGSCLAGN